MITDLLFRIENFIPFAIMGIGFSVLAIYFAKKCARLLVSRGMNGIWILTIVTGLALFYVTIGILARPLGEAMSDIIVDIRIPPKPAEDPGVMLNLNRGGAKGAASASDIVNIRHSLSFSNCAPFQFELSVYISLFVGLIFLFISYSSMKADYFQKLRKSIGENKPINDDDLKKMTKIINIVPTNSGTVEVAGQRRMRLPYDDGINQSRMPSSAVLCGLRMILYLVVSAVASGLAFQRIDEAPISHPTNCEHYEHHSEGGIHSFSYVLVIKRDEFQLDLGGMAVWFSLLAASGIGFGLIEKRITSGRWLVEERKRVRFFLAWCGIFPAAIIGGFTLLL